MAIIRLNVPNSIDYDDAGIFEDYNDYFSDLKKNLKRPLIFILGILGLPLLLISFILRCVSIVFGFIAAGCVWIQNGDIDDLNIDVFILYVLLSIAKLLLYIPSLIFSITFVIYIIINYASLLLMLPYYFITKRL